MFSKTRSKNKISFYKNLRIEYVIYQLVFTVTTFTLAISLLITAACMIFFPASDLKLLALFLSALTTTLTLIYNARRNATEDALKEARESFSKAFELLEDNNNPQLALASKVRWASAVALLKVATSMKENIHSNSAKYRYEAERNYWRLRFSEIIHFCGDGYYMAGSRESSGWIEKDHVVIICKFSGLIKSNNYLDATLSDSQRKLINSDSIASGLWSFLRQ